MAEKKINGKEYRVEMMDAVNSLHMLARITKIVGPFMGQLKGIQALIAQMSDENDTSAEADAMAQQTILAIAAQINPDEITKLVTDLVSNAQVRTGRSESYETCHFDEDFHGDVMGGIQVAIYVATVNYGNFLKGQKPTR